MALQSLGSYIHWPDLMPIGVVGFALTSANIGLDATGEYHAQVLCASEAMTISHVGFLPGTVAGSPTVDIRIETLDATTGLPSGSLWAANTNIVSGTLTSNTWQLEQLTSAASISAGQVFCVKIKQDSGTSVALQYWDFTSETGMPYMATGTGAAARAIATQKPWALGSSSTAFYYVNTLLPVSSVSGVTFTTPSGAAAVARGLRFKVPFKCTCCGLCVRLSAGTVGDFSIVMYDDAGSELSTTSTAFDKDVLSGANSVFAQLPFDTDVTLSAATWYRACVIPSGTGAVRWHNLNLPNSNYVSAWPHKANAHYTERVAGTWDDSQTAVIPGIGLMLNKLDDGVNTASGGVSGVVGT